MIFHLFASASVRYFVTLIFCLLIVALHYIVFKVQSSPRLFSPVKHRFMQSLVTVVLFHVLSLRTKRFGGLKWNRTIDLTLIRRAL